MSCYNTEHAPTPEGVACADCYKALDAEHTALNDRYMRLLQANGELERKVREAEGLLKVTPLPDGHGKTEASEAGFETLNGVDYLQAVPRSRLAREDVVVVACGHRTLGSPRSILLERPMVEALHEWFGKWLANGWPGVPRRCGVHFRPNRLSDWQCDLEPGHLEGDGRTWYHEGPAIGWSSDLGKPGRARWTPDGKPVMGW